MSVQRIIAERDAGGIWRAWYSDAPGTGFISKRPWAAISYLVSLFPERRIDPATLVPDASKTRENHREFTGVTPRMDR